MPSYTSDPKGETSEARKARIARHHAQTIELLAPKTVAETDGYDATAGAYVQPEIIMGAGVVTPPGQRRFSRAYASMRAGKGTWAMVTVTDAHKPPETLRQLGTYGWAVSPFGDADTAVLARAAAQGKATVLVRDADGTITIKPVSEYRRIRRERKAAAQAKVSAAEARAQRDYALQASMGTIHDDAA